MVVNGGGGEWNVNDDGDDETKLLQLLLSSRQDFLQLLLSNPTPTLLLNSLSY